MDRAVFKQALSATARVACAAALVGCVKSAPKPAAEPLATEPASESSPAESLTEEASGEAEEELSCLEQVDAVRDQGPEAMPACCEAAVSFDTSLEMDMALRSACCSLSGWNPEIAPGCTPWGPPRPPAMGVRLSAARKVRAVRAAALAGVA